MQEIKNIPYYQVIHPDPLLTPYIGCYWILRNTKVSKPRRELILPDGYAELILNYGTPYSWHDPHRQIERVIDKVQIVGERDFSVMVDLNPGLNQIGVKMKPIGLFVLLHQPLNLLANQILKPDELSIDVLQELYEQIYEADSDQSKINLLNKFFLKRLLIADLPELLISKALQIILKQQGNLRIDSLTEYLDIHYKTLERKFKTYVGLSPKTFARIVRFKNTYKQFHANAHQDSSFFLDLGYYDQNHFIKDFKYFLHTTPSKYYRQQQSLSDEIVRRGLVERAMSKIYYPPAVELRHA
ncbi:MAG: helix-turn-helix domain-containing protein [Mojavia pulchra JT2-VF2]|jgi:AraC-like DNA-binding protein|uniref:Helix-turn-helix domain-containing protein n=1 Tax=Mojavia pulchra JT2-VF2 TaxID=287848 RepID=A0A951UKI2_9NOST|nr:helix-turn-helix domain-containing protein [Mojavia pulchra JT2-VF2]